MARPIAVRQPTIKSKQEVALMRRAGHIVAEVLAILAEAARPGMTTAELDAIAQREIEARDGTPSFLGYLGYPATICTSFNEEIVHGIPGARAVREGDILSIDCGAIYAGFQGDAALTLCIGDVPAETRTLVEVTRGALAAGIAAARPGARLSDVSHAIQSYVEGQPRPYGIIREYVGHGIGREMHEEPMVPNFGLPNRGIALRPGLALAIEPMLTLGDWRTVVGPDEWTVSTKDGSLSAHFEHSIVITENGAEVLTSLDGKP
ncbi:MAG: type I methionyl aminopeptidase [Chloroflexi bacterium]|nr:type I methionyl aminopeptidase [Chloroflexota bacterium]